MTVTVSVLLLMILWCGIELWAAYTMEPAIQENYGEDLRELVATWQEPRGRNAWDDLSLAVRLHRERGDSFYSEELDTGWLGGGWGYDLAEGTPDDYELFQDVVCDAKDEDDCEALLELLRGWAFDQVDSLESAGIAALLDSVATANYACIPISDSSLDGAILANRQLQDSRLLLRCLYTRMQIARDEKDWVRYAETYRWIKSVNSAITYQPGTINQLVAYAGESALMERVLMDLQGGRLGADAIQLLSAEERSAKQLNPLSRTFNAERYILLDDLQKYFASNGRLIKTEYAKLSQNPPDTHWISNVSSIWSPKWSSYEREIHSHFESAVATARLPYQELKAHRERLKEQVGPVSTQTLFPVLDESLSFEERFLDSAPFSMASLHRYNYKLIRHGLLQVLAIELYRIDNGKLPDSLGELVPLYLPESIGDLCELDSKPWRYSISEPGDESPLGYLLYSVGYDSIDDGGTRPGGYLTQGLSPSNDGIDFVVSHPVLHSDESD